MELVTSLLTFAKGVFPATVGSIIAVWRKRKEVKFEEMSVYQKVSMLVVIISAIVIGVCIGKWVGGAIALYFGVEQGVQMVLIEFATALNGLKIVDSLIKSAESALDIVTENVPILINKVVGAISDKIDKLFGKK